MNRQVTKAHEGKVHEGSQATAISRKLVLNNPAMLAAWNGRNYLVQSRRRADDLSGSCELLTYVDGAGGSRMPKNLAKDDTKPD